MADVTSHKSYRPLTVFTYRLNRLLFGNSPFSFHLVNVLLHVWLVNRFFWFVRYLGLDAMHSFMTVIIFGLHPVNSESVANCVGRAEILSAHFFLSAINSREDSILSGAFAFLSMLCKEGGVFSLALLVGIEIALLLRSTRSPSISSEFWIFVSSKLFLWLGYLLMFTSLRLCILSGTYPIFTPHDNPAAHAPTVFSRIFTKVYYWVTHYFLLLCPKDRILEYS